MAKWNYTVRSWTNKDSFLGPYGGGHLPRKAFYFILPNRGVQFVVIDGLEVFLGINLSKS